jgi:hypothetical protein
MENGILGLRGGEAVEVLSEPEILATLDESGSVEGIPFMPEMKRFCGRKFRVFKRADKICVEGAYVSRLRDAVFLEDVRCDGVDHDGCKRMCLIFWKEAWLKRIEPGQSPEPPVDWVNIPEPENTKPVDTQKVYSCQSTALPKAVEHLSGWDPSQYVRDIASRSFTPWQVLKAIFINFYNMAMRYRGGEEFGAAVGKEIKTPVVDLNLKRGDLVEVKSRKEIEETLDTAGKNRGLRIDYEMLRHAGKRFQVLRRVDRIILETTGQMRGIKNTVLLDNGGCEGLCRRACARTSHPMWREAWLKPVDEQPNPQHRH